MEDNEMANYRQIHVSIWKDEWFLDLEPEEKLLFIYLFSNENASLAGIYKLAFKVICFETCLEPEFVHITLDKFSMADKVHYEDGVVWVVNMRNYHETTSSKVQTRILKDLEEIPHCQLKERYLYRMDTLSLKEKRKEENIKEEEVNTATAISSFHSHSPRLAEKLYIQVTGQMSIPSTNRDRVIDDLITVLDYFGGDIDKAVNSGKPWFQKWCATKRKDGGNYSPTNPAWIDKWLENLAPEPEEYKPPEKEPQFTEEERSRIWIGQIEQANADDPEKADRMIRMLAKEKRLIDVRQQ